MSDLHRAVEAEIQAFTPDRTPPLSALVARKRSRDRRRYAIAGTALSMLAVGGVALASGPLTGAPDTATSVAGGPATTGDGPGVVFDVEPEPARTREGLGEPGFGVGADACVRLPGTSDLSEFMSIPAKYQVTVTGAEAVREFRSCIDKVVGYTAVITSELVPVPPLPAPTDATGARICLPREECVVLEEAAAQDLARTVLAESRPDPNGIVCFVASEDYSLTFLVRNKEYETIVVPVADCFPAQAYGEYYSLSEAARARIDEAYGDSRRSSPGRERQGITLPTSEWTPGSASRTASLGGVVTVRQVGDELCVVLETAQALVDDVEFMPTPVIWPKGYTATAGSLEIRDPNGQVVAREDTPISFSGGIAPVEPGDPCMLGYSDAAFVMSELPPA